MKFITAVVLILSLTACKTEKIVIDVDSTLQCVTTNANGEVVAQREIPYKESFSSYVYRPIGWTYRGNAWVVTDLYYDDSKVWKSVTPFPGEACTPTQE